MLGTGSHIAHCFRLALVLLSTSSLCPGASRAQWPRWVAGNPPFLMCVKQE